MLTFKHIKNNKQKHNLFPITLQKGMATHSSILGLPWWLSW